MSFPSPSSCTARMTNYSYFTFLHLTTEQDVARIIITPQIAVQACRIFYLIDEVQISVKMAMTTEHLSKMEIQLAIGLTPPIFLTLTVSNCGETVFLPSKRRASDLWCSKLFFTSALFLLRYVMYLRTLLCNHFYCWNPSFSEAFCWIISIVTLQYDMYMTFDQTGAFARSTDMAMLVSSNRELPVINY